MSGGNRLHGIAIRGWLIAAILLGPFEVALAQTAEDAEEYPAIEAGQDDDTEAEQIEPNAAGPQTVTPEPEEVAKPETDAPIEQTPAQEPGYYARNDLIAQQRMAEAGDRLVYLTRWQIGVGAAETLLFLITVGLTIIATRAAIRATRAAQDSVKVAADTAERQLRAYVHPAKPEIRMTSDGHVAAVVPFENTGQTPAYQLKCWVVIAVLPHPFRADFPSLPPDPKQMSSYILSSGRQVILGVGLPDPVNQNDREVIARHEGAFYVYGHATYRDAFNKKRTTTFRFMYHGPWEGTQTLSVCQEGNEAD